MRNKRLGKFSNAFVYVGVFFMASFFLFSVYVISNFVSKINDPSILKAELIQPLSNSRIKGVVYYDADSNGTYTEGIDETIENIKINIYHKDGGVYTELNERQSDQFGYFEFQDLPTNTYYFEVEPKTYDGGNPTLMKRNLYTSRGKEHTFVECDFGASSECEYNIELKSLNTDREGSFLNDLRVNLKDIAKIIWPSIWEEEDDSQIDLNYDEKINLGDLSMIIDKRFFEFPKSQCSSDDDCEGVDKCENGYCVVECQLDEDCDDGNNCTTNSCNLGECELTNIIDNHSCEMLGICSDGECIPDSEPGAFYSKIFDFGMTYSVRDVVDKGDNLLTFITHDNVLKIVELDNESEILDERYLEFESTINIAGVSSTSDGGYILVGAYEEDAMLLKLDSDYEIVWQGAYGDQLQPQVGRAIKQVSDGGYIAAGQTRAEDSSITSRQWEDFYYFKVNADGELVWETVGYSPDTSDIMYSVEEIDGYYYFAGIEDVDRSKREYYIVKADISGTVIWEEILDGSWSSGNGRPINIKETEDGNLDFFGHSYSKPSSNGSWRHNLEYFKISSEDSSVMSFHRYYSSFNNFVYNSGRTSDGGYILVGRTDRHIEKDSNTNIYVLKLDSEFNKEWDRVIGGPGNDSPVYVKETEDGDYLLIANTRSYLDGNTMWSMKLNSVGETCQYYSSGDCAGYIQPECFSNNHCDDQDPWTDDVCNFENNTCIYKAKTQTGSCTDDYDCPQDTDCFDNYCDAGQCNRDFIRVNQTCDRYYNSSAAFFGQTCMDSIPGCGTDSVSMGLCESNTYVRSGGANGNGTHGVIVPLASYDLIGSEEELIAIAFKYLDENNNLKCNGRGALLNTLGVLFGLSTDDPETELVKEGFLYNEQIHFFIRTTNYVCEVSANYDTTTYYGTNHWFPLGISDIVNFKDLSGSNEIDFTNEENCTYLGPYPSVD